MLKITLVKSLIKGKDFQKGTVQALGLHKIGSSVIKEDTPEIKGMIKRISHLLKVEEIDGEVK